MSGLREKHRADRDRRILEAAADLFRNAGYEGATIEAIAAKAEVSVGTIYNYYRNKGDLLVAIVSLEVNDVLKAGEALVKQPPENAGDALDALLGIYVEHSLSYLSKEMWRQAMAISTQQPDSPFGHTYNALDRALADQVCSLIVALQARGSARTSAEARPIGELVFNNMNMMFIEFVKSGDATIAGLRQAIRRQNRVVVEAIRP